MLALKISNLKKKRNIFTKWHYSKREKIKAVNRPDLTFYKDIASG